MAERCPAGTTAARSALVYHVSDEHTDSRQAHALFFSETPSTPAFFSLRRSKPRSSPWPASFLHGGPKAVGSMTSGGTESILMAVKAYRDRARAPHLSALSTARPEIVTATTVHPASEQGRPLPGREDHPRPHRSRLSHGRRSRALAIGPRTVALVGSPRPIPTASSIPSPGAQRAGAGPRPGICTSMPAGGFFPPLPASSAIPSRRLTSACPA